MALKVFRRRGKLQDAEIKQIKGFLPGLYDLFKNEDAVLLAGDIEFKTNLCNKKIENKGPYKCNPIDALLITQKAVVLIELKNYNGGQICFEARKDDDGNEVEQVIHKKYNKEYVVQGGMQGTPIDQVICNRNGLSNDGKSGLIDYLYSFFFNKDGKKPPFSALDKSNDSEKFPAFIIFTSAGISDDYNKVYGYKWLHIVNNNSFKDELQIALKSASISLSNGGELTFPIDEIKAALEKEENVFVPFDDEEGPAKRPLWGSLAAILVAVSLIGFAIYKAVDAFRHPSEPKRIENTEVRTSPKAEQSYQDGIRAYQDGDMAEAEKCFAKASGKGHVKAAYNLGLMYYNDGKFDDALSLFKQAADSDDRDALFYLGVMYMEGKGVLKDSAKALNYWKKAIEKGSTEAMYSFGEYYYTLKNYTEALPYFKTAASLGHAPSMYIMSVFYDYGLGGLPHDPSQARAWENRALANGYVPYR